MPRRLWATWVVLKHRRSVYRPGTRARVWWKAKHRLVLPVELTCAPVLVEWGDWGQAAVMEFGTGTRARVSW
jgi:ATP-dependent DNA ligase